ncbi:MAG: SoxR reducing system RseC family protein [Pseudomonadota bacterium]
MLETEAVVMRVEAQQTFVRSEVGSCSQCQGKGCGASKLSQLFCNKPRQFLVDNRIQARVGDQVVVMIEDGAVLRGVGLAYLLPLLGLFAGAALGNVLAGLAAPVDAYTASGALIGLAVGFWVARKIASGQSRQLPYIARHSQS